MMVLGPLDENDLPIVGFETIPLVGLSLTRVIVSLRRAGIVSSQSLNLALEHVPRRTGASLL